MNKGLLWANGLLVGLVVVLGLFLQSQDRLGAQSNFSGPINSDAGYLESGTEIINTSGAFIGTVSSTAVQRFSGEISLGANCSSATWNPGAVVSSTVATTSISMPSGYEVGDVLWAGLSTSTCAASDAACLILNITPPRVVSGTVVLAQLSSPGSGNVASIDIATSTLSVCYADVP